MSTSEVVWTIENNLSVTPQTPDKIISKVPPLLFSSSDSERKLSFLFRNMLACLLAVLGLISNST